MQFTVADRSAPAPAPARTRPQAPKLGRFRKAYTRPGRYEVVWALTRDGEWLFILCQDGTWDAVSMTAEAVVREGLRSLAACRAWTVTAGAREALDRITASEPA